MQALGWLDAVARELMLFAAAGMLIGGVDDLALDACWAALCVRRRRRRLTLATLPSARPTRFALFVPAWDEAAVIAPMLRATLARLEGHEFRVFVGVYPNDPATRAAAETVAAADARVHLVIAPEAGPTTKADNLNSMWRSMRSSDWVADAIVLHDAEDVVHPRELDVFAALLPRHEVVQLPVLPIVAPGSPLLSGHHADEFAESHTRGMAVRGAIGASLPLAGVGCAIAASLLTRVAATRGGAPFDADSLVEDYELGLRLTAVRGCGCFARVRDASGALIAIRAIFPDTLTAAIWQKARWMTGIALAGWDRTGWVRAGGRLTLADHWMRWRDRRAPLAMLVLAAAWLATLGWSAAALAHWATGRAGPPVPRWLSLLLAINFGLLVWRLAMRMLLTGRAYGLLEALWSLPRFFVGNGVTLLATPRAMLLYARLLAGRAPAWDKTAHAFPAAGELP